MGRKRLPADSSDEPGAAVRDFLTALGLVLVIEGFIYGWFPGLARRMAAQLAELPEGTLRVAGLAAAVTGTAIVWLIRG